MHSCRRLCESDFDERERSVHFDSCGQDSVLANCMCKDVEYDDTHFRIQAAGLLLATADGVKARMDQRGVLDSDYVCTSEFRRLATR